MRLSLAKRIQQPEKENVVHGNKQSGFSTADTRFADFLLTDICIYSLFQFEYDLQNGFCRRRKYI